MKNAISLFLPAGFVACFGCQAVPDKEAPKSDHVSSAHAAVGVAPVGEEHAKDEGCTDHHGKTAANDVVRKGKDPQTGAEMSLVGEPLASVEAVSVKELVAKPDVYAGKTVRIEGNVNAMCHHRRSWFSVQDEGERGGAFVRVLTGPSFLVPAGSIGRKARVEGKVDVIEVSAGAAKHYAKGHKIGDPNKIDGPVRRVVIRAAGAELI